MRANLAWAAMNVAGLVGLGAQVSSHLPPEHPVIVLVPMGDVPAELVEAAEAVLAARLGARISIEPYADLPEAAWNSAEERADADVLTAWGDAFADPGAWKVVVLTDAPLLRRGDLGLEAVVGTGEVRGRTSVVSAYRVMARGGTDAAIARRFTDVVLHEVGHTLGLRHCQVAGCVMVPSDGDVVAWADLRRHAYCPLCHLKAPRGLLRVDGSPVGAGVAAR